MTIGNIFKHCCLTSSVILVAYFLNLAIYFDYLNSNLVPIGKGNCTQITNSEPAVGPEDLTLYDDDILLTGSDYKLELFEGEPHFHPGNIPTGNIFAIYPKLKLLKKLAINGYPQNVDFRPHGIYLQKVNNQKILSVLNHAYNKGGELVDQFTVQEQAHNSTYKTLTLYYLRSFSFESEFNGILNDLIFLDETQFIITKYLNFPDPVTGRNTEGHLNSLFATFLISLKYKNTKAYYCTGHSQLNVTKKTQCTPLENTKAVMANGITWNKKDKVFIADTLKKEVNVYKLNLTNPQILTFDSTIKLSGHPDNVEYDERTNQVYAGMIGKAYEHFVYVLQFKKKWERPSKMNLWVGIDVIDADTNVVKNIFMRDDVYSVFMFKQIYQTCSSAFMFNEKTLLLGSWAEKSVLLCDLE